MRFIACGLRKGKMPSSTKYSASAANKSDQFIELVSAASIASNI